MLGSSAGGDPSPLIKSTLSALTKLKGKVAEASVLDNVSKVTRFLLTNLLGEVLHELTDQGTKLHQAVKASKICFTNLQGLSEVVKEIADFVRECESVAVFFLAKSRLKRKDSTLRTTLRARATQLQSSIVLCMLSQPSARRGGGSVGLGNVVISAASSADASATSGSASPRTSAPSSSSNVHEIDASHFSSGHMFYHGIGRPRNWSAAFYKFLEAAELGDPDAMAMCARCYLQGQGTEVDAEQGRVWLSRAALAGSNAAKVDLAIVLLAEVPSDGAAVVAAAQQQQQQQQQHGKQATAAPSKAQVASIRTGLGGFRQALRSLLSPASPGANSPRHHHQGDDGEEDEEEERERQQAIEWGVGEALRLLLEAAGDCYTEAQTLLAGIQLSAGQTAEALRWYRLAVADGDPSAMVGLGKIYLSGAAAEGLEANPAHALSLFLSAGRAGNAEGYYFAGVACEAGPSPNMAEALRCYQLAAEANVREAHFAYGYTLVREARIAASGLALESAPAATLQAYQHKCRVGLQQLRMAAELGVVDASFQLGRCYEQGLPYGGSVRDEQAAYQQFTWAAAQGHAQAALCAANLLYTGFHSGLPSEAELHGAARYYILAASQGSGAGLNSLGLLVEDGRLDSKDVSAAEAHKLNLVGAGRGLELLHDLNWSSPLYPSSSASSSSSIKAGRELRDASVQAQFRTAAMLYHAALVAEDHAPEAAVNLAMILAAGQLPSFVSATSPPHLVTIADCLAMLRALPPSHHLERCLDQVELAAVMLAEAARFDREWWTSRAPPPLREQAAAVVKEVKEGGADKRGKGQIGWAKLRSLTGGEGGSGRGGSGGGSSGLSQVVLAAAAQPREALQSSQDDGFTQPSSFPLSRPGPRTAPPDVASSAVDDNDDSDDLPHDDPDSPPNPALQIQGGQKPPPKPARTLASADPTTTGLGPQR